MRALLSRLISAAVSASKVAVVEVGSCLSDVSCLAAVVSGTRFDDLPQPTNKHRTNTVPVPIAAGENPANILLDRKNSSNFQLRRFIKTQKLFVAIRWNRKIIGCCSRHHRAALGQTANVTKQRKDLFICSTFSFCGRNYLRPSTIANKAFPKDKERVAFI